MREMEARKVKKVLEPPNEPMTSTDFPIRISLTNLTSLTLLTNLTHLPPLPISLTHLTSIPLLAPL